MNERRRPATRQAPRAGLHVGPVRVTLWLIVVILALIGSVAFIGYVVLNIQDDQISLLSAGFLALGTSFAALAIGALLGMWRAASRAEGGRAFALAIAGGMAGMAAIGSFSVTALLTMLLNT